MAAGRREQGGLLHREARLGHCGSSGGTGRARQIGHSLSRSVSSSPGGITRANASPQRAQMRRSVALIRRIALDHSPRVRSRLLDFRGRQPSARGATHDTFPA
jgi:hypothetical protein